MAWGGSSDPQRFEQAIAWFAERAVFTKEEWLGLATQVQARAFTISGVAQLDVVTTVHESLATAIAEGTDFGEWRKQVGEQLEAEWGGTVARPAHRAETIYRNAVQNAYNAGRYEAQTRPAVMLARPYRMVDAVLDDSTSAICRGLNGITLPADHPWWDSHWPPFHHRCRTAVRTLRKSEGEARIADGWDQVDTIDADAEPSDGWGAAPNRPQWEPRAEDYPPALWNAYEQARTPAGAPLPDRVADVIDEAAD